MSVTLKILWFEDNVNWYNITNKNLVKYINSLYFMPEFIKKETVDITDIDDIIDKKSFDLILIDLNLANNKKGKEVIKEIRNKNVLTDILFYSSKQIDIIKNELSGDYFEGIYICTREDFIFKAQMLIDKVRMRSENIRNMRGMLVEKVSNYDLLLKEIIIKYLDYLEQNDDNNLCKLNNKAYKMIKEHSLEKLENCIENKKQNFIRETIDNPSLFESSKISQLVGYISKDNSYQKMMNFHDDYIKSILHERNMLSHIKHCTDDTGNFYIIDKNQKTITYDSDKCKEIRKNIMCYDKLLYEASEYFNEKLDK